MNVSSGCKGSRGGVAAAAYLRRKQAEREILEEREAKRLKDYLNKRG